MGVLNGELPDFCSRSSDVLINFYDQDDINLKYLSAKINKKLTKKYGFQKAKLIRGEGVNSVEWLIDFIKNENFDCDLKREGRFHGAHTPIEFKKMVAECNNLKDNEGIVTQIIDKSDQKNEINSDLYHGGVVFPQHASLNAAKYHKDLIEKAIGLGVSVISNCEMVNFKKKLDEFSVLTCLLYTSPSPRD